MSLVRAAELARSEDHEGELSLASPELPIAPHELTIFDGPPSKCLVCGHFIDKHPGTGRKPHTCGRMQCVRVHRRMMLWRTRNKKSRAEMVARFTATAPPQAPQAKE